MYTYVRILIPLIEEFGIVEWRLLAEVTPQHLVEMLNEGIAQVDHDEFVIRQGDKVLAEKIDCYNAQEQYVLHGVERSEERKQTEKEGEEEMFRDMTPESWTEMQDRLKRLAE